MLGDSVLRYVRINGSSHRNIPIEAVLTSGHRRIKWDGGYSSAQARADRLCWVGANSAGLNRANLD